MSYLVIYPTDTVNQILNKMSICFVNIIEINKIIDVSSQKQEQSWYHQNEIIEITSVVLYQVYPVIASRTLVESK